MPKVILGEQNRRNKALASYMDGKIGRKLLFKTGYDLAEAIGISYASVWNWHNNGFPKFFTILCRLFKVTKIKDYELCKIFGVEYKGESKHVRYDFDPAETRTSS